MLKPSLNQFGIRRTGSRYLGLGSLKNGRLGCSLDTTLLSIKKRLKVYPNLVNVPSANNNLKGLIDLPSMVHIDYSADEMGKLVSFEDIT